MINKKNPELAPGFFLLSVKEMSQIALRKPLIHRTR